MLHELRIGFANAGGVIHFVARNQQCHRHTVVCIGAVLAHGTQTVGFFQRQGISTRGVQPNAQSLASQGNSGIEVGAWGEIL